MSSGTTRPRPRTSATLTTNRTVQLGLCCRARGPATRHSAVSATPRPRSGWGWSSSLPQCSIVSASSWTCGGHLTRYVESPSSTQHMAFKELTITTMVYNKTIRIYTTFVLKMYINYGYFILKISYFYFVAKGLI